LALGRFQVGAKTSPAASFIYPGGAYYDQFAAGTQALGMHGRSAAHDADRGEFYHLVCDRHQRGNWAEWIAGECGVEAGQHNSLAQVDEFEGELDDGLVEELRLVDADYLDIGKQSIERLAQAGDVGDGDCLVSLRAVRGDRGAMVAKIYIRLEACDSLARNAGAPEAANQFLALAGEHGTGDDFNATRCGRVHDADCLCSLLSEAECSNHGNAIGSALLKLLNVGGKMISGTHVIVYSKDAEADRAFLRDVLGFAWVDAGHGWLIFALPPAEIAVHPAHENGTHELYFMCDDLKAEMALLARKGVECSQMQEERWGSITRMRLPGGGEVGLYQPKHSTALNLK